MTSHRLILLTRPLPGREEEFLAWYTQEHVRDVAQLAGVVAGQLFKADSGGSSLAWPYMTIYEISNPAIAGAAIRDIQAERTEAGNPPGEFMYVTDAIDDDRAALWFTAVSDRFLNEVGS